MKLQALAACALGFLGLGMEGVAANAPEYKMHEKIPVMVNNVGPFNNPAETYSFYSLPFCQPEEHKDHDHSLGQVLAGDRRKHALYDVRFKVDVQWQALCRMSLDPNQITQFIDAIKHHYIFEMFVDNLPVKGFVGETETHAQYTDDNLMKNVDGKTYLFTHLDFSIAYNGNHVIAVNLTTDPEQRVELNYEHTHGLPVEFSFGIHWHPTTHDVADRMELHTRDLVSEQPLEIHWLSIINSVVLVVLLTAFVAIIFMRVLKKDFTRYMELDEEDFDDTEDSGWKLLHGDVFRFPAYPMLLSSAIGTGAQLFAMTIFILILALFGAFYPGSRGAIYSASVFLYALTAGIAGYVSTRMYVQLGGDKWATNAVLTACLFAAPVFIVFCITNTIAIFYGASAAMPFGTIMIVIFLWALVTFPLTVLGAMRGRTPEPYSAPCKTNRAMREIPPTPWFRSPAVFFLFAGFLPFSAIYIELHYIFASVWGQRVYTLFEILALAFVMLLMVTSTLSVALTYFQLVGEDYNWWWRSFINGAATGFFMYAYAFFYFHYRSEMFGMLQTSMFFGYFGMVAYAFSLMLGALSFFVAHKFVRHIYSSIKID